MNYVSEITGELTSSETNTNPLVLSRVMIATKFTQINELLEAMRTHTFFISRHKEVLNEAYMLLIDVIEDYPEIQGESLYDSALNLKRIYSREVLLDSPKIHNMITVLIGHIREVNRKKVKQN